MTLRAPLANGALAGSELPSRLRLLSWGDNPSVKGPVRISEVSRAAMEVGQPARGYETVALDFEHNTVPGSPEFNRTQEPRRVAGYGKPRVVPSDGLYLEDITWTPAGRAEAANFADLSPAVELDARGNVVFVHSAALTRNGAVEGLTFFSVDQTIMSDTTAPAGATDKLTLASVAAALGLGAEATPAEVMQALHDLQAAAKQAAADDKPAKEALTSLSAAVASLRRAVEAQAERAEASEKGKVLALFAAEGKAPLSAEGRAYTAEELGALDLPTLRVLLANTPVTVALSARSKRPSEGRAAGLSGLARAIEAHRCGA